MIQPTDKKLSVAGAAFCKGMRVQIWSSDEKVVRGERTIADIENGELVLEGGYPEGTVAGDFVSRAPEPLPPIEVHEAEPNTGTFSGLKRSSYPGRLYTPRIP